MVQKETLAKLLLVERISKDQNWTSCHSQMTEDISVRLPRTVCKWKPLQREYSLHSRFRDRRWSLVSMMEWLVWEWQFAGCVAMTVDCI